MSVTSVCGVILVTENVDSLARFYIEGLGLALEREDHGDLDLHYGVDLGQLHFAIHPPSNFGGRGKSSGTAVAFAVTSLDEHLPRVLERGAEIVREPHDEGFGKMATLADPEGNLFELIELRYSFDKK